MNIDVLGERTLSKKVQNDPAAPETDCLGSKKRRGQAVLKHARVQELSSRLYGTSWWKKESEDKS